MTNEFQPTPSLDSHNLHKSEISIFEEKLQQQKNKSFNRSIVQNSLPFV